MTSGGRVRFRNYRPSDIEAMFQLDALCFSESFQFDRQMMRQFAEAPGAVVLLIEDLYPAELIAFIILHLEGVPGDSYAYIVTIDVSPARRRAGTGAAMLHRAEAAARSAGASRVGLHVASSNSAAIAFYEHQGYKRDGVAKLFYREAGQDALVFSKRL